MPTERKDAAAKWSLLMQKKLDRDSHKGSWTETSPDTLYRLLMDEVDELTSEIDPDKIMHEAADVANLAFMFAEAVRKRELEKTP